MTVKNATFGRALEVLKAGGVMKRAGWINTWIVLVPGTTRPLTLESPYGRALIRTGRAERMLTIDSHIDWFDGDGGMMPGWTPSQVDMLADDWELIDGQD